MSDTVRLDSGGASGESIAWRPIILDRSRSEDAVQMDHLLDSGQVWRVSDTLEQQLHDLIRTRMHRDDVGGDDLDLRVQQLTGGASLREFGRWIYYPWCGRLVHLLPPDEFRELRLDRNRLKITTQEQARLSRFTVGIVGLSVGNAIAYTLALEGACGHLKLADFDQLSLSNMNRLRAGIHEIGTHKTVLLARQIFELDPYARLSLFHEGLTPENLDEFLLGNPALDAVVDECDSMRMKVLLRERARSLSLPMLMETSDRGMLDVERFDLEPDRPVLHGLLGDVSASDIPPNLSDADRIKLVLAIAGIETASTRAVASILEIKESISTWPQLGSDVTLGGASMTAAIRRLALGQPLPSGRRYIDLQAILEGPAVQLQAVQPPPSGSPYHPSPVLDERVPEYIRFLVEHGTRAPSSGNCQPWQFYYDGSRLWVVHDRQRSKSHLDGAHHMAYLALGAAIENMRIAAAQRGYRTQLETFPRAGDQCTVASLGFAADGGGAASDAASLFAQIQRRVTNRTLSPRVPLAPGHMSALTTVCSAYGCQLNLLTEEAELAELGRILGKVDRIRFLCRELHREMMADIRWTAAEAEQTCDGLNLATLGLAPAQAVAMKLLARPDVAALLREADGGTALEKGAHSAMQASSAVALLTVDGQRPADILRAGQVFERLWLTATAMGLAFHPSSTAIYLFPILKTDAASIFTDSERTSLLELEARFNQLFPSSPGQLPLMLFRIFLPAAPAEQALRLPIERVLFYSEPPPVAELQSGTEAQDPASPRIAD